MELNQPIRVNIKIETDAKTHAIPRRAAKARKRTPKSFNIYFSILGPWPGCYGPMAGLLR